MDEQIYIYPDYSSLAFAVAMQIAVVINDAITTRGKCVIALSGGETPKGVYRNLGSAPFNMEIDWSRVHLFFGDERMVPADDAHYGEQGDYSNCIHYYPDDKEKYEACIRNPATDFQGEINEENLKAGILRRLMYNPNFAALKVSLQRFIDSLN